MFDFCASAVSRPSIATIIDEIDRLHVCTQTRCFHSMDDVVRDPNVTDGQSLMLLPALSLAVYLAVSL